MKNRHTIIALTISLILLALIAYQLGNRYLIKKPKAAIQLVQAKNDLDITFGPDTANLTIHMYSSYACSHCQNFFTEVYPQLLSNYMNNGKVNLAVRLVDFSSNQAVNDANKISVCISRYGNFQKLHELFIASYKIVSTPEFQAMVEEFTIADELVAECYFGGEAETYLTQVKNQFTELKLKGTPTFIIGNNAYSGFISFEQLSKVIDQHLSAKHTN